MMPKTKKVRVFKLKSGRLWHWWCPRCYGGDFSTDWRTSLDAATLHASWHAVHQRMGAILDRQILGGRA